VCVCVYVCESFRLVLCGTYDTGVVRTRCESVLYACVCVCVFVCVCMKCVCVRTCMSVQY